ncbi:helix-turn-helix transcriptional regulator [Leucobacter viscericola]|uniref:Helix-turn-helix transcriptional regulator n=1 Tax=Leucobacter viscericola TaxID=2714935 RepID=A0A6G7XGH9_9MICO|nr:helix-turn-helix transcriptional regulator [Leucobacter viscericola]
MAQAVRVLLNDRKQSQDYLAESTGISLSTLKRRMSNASSFTIDELFEIADHFDVSVNAVLGCSAVDVAPPRRDSHCEKCRPWPVTDCQK